MVHNGIEYGLMAANAEGLGGLREANIGKQKAVIDARPRRCAPLSSTSTSESKRYGRGVASRSVVASWLLDF